MKEIKNENVENIEVIEEEDIDVVKEEMEEKKSPMDWLKKNGKKVAKIAAVGAGLIAAYAIGKGTHSNSEVIDADWSEVTNDETDLSSEEN